ncbi:1-acyl-sn-glycerol-3-phosphate acyltransferase [Alsobacter metallidurans]|uniref:1-acyl-sn-glycerol-3-phosphate acyltransferase n=1 Tax=Alsobacter metallidurans TaxID=340221 RepID=A0A917MM80_9HYPH|nr:lysophospholipid acyltransferase family protein [Alsobacter metallidurans]GGH33802.1 1-acyl-sn-glycerol-3-phosphate acyltransferase [Alsobacter metallidurans]
MRRLRLAAVLAVLVPVTLVLMAVQWTALRAGWRVAHTLPRRFHRFVCALFRIRIEVRGAPASMRPVLVVANHTSWLDIVVISTLAPMSFIAKQEVASWPVFGAFARLQRSIFIDRQRRKGAAEANREIAERLAGGDAIVLFAEGTTSDGCRVLPFKSAVIGAARDAIAEAGHTGSVTVQPLTVAYPRRAGLPVGRQDRAALAWYGDMDLLPHLGPIIAGAPIDAVVEWGEPIPFGVDSNRKAVTRICETTIRAAYARLITGRGPTEG